MSRREIKLPENFSHPQFGIILDQEKDILKGAISGPSEVIFDLSGTNYVSNLGLLLIAQFGDRLAKFDCQCKFRYGEPINESLMARFIGMMGLVDRKLDKDFVAYLDTIRVSVHRCFNGDESLKAVNKLMPVVKAKFEPTEEVLKALNWALWEIVDNAGGHGYGGFSGQEMSYLIPVYFCAVARKDEIDISILDCGCGIQNSLTSSGKPEYRNISNAEALALAIKDETSGHPAGSPGFGLYGCAEIARDANGQLTILSGSRKLLLSGKELTVETSPHYQGTMVSLKVPKSASINLKRIFGNKSTIAEESFEDQIGEYNEPN
ncbi:hypothetical protein ACFL4J_01015 [Candidatus Margulisiibacteriota bacterium]